MTNRNQFVMVGTGAVIATAQHIPVSMMLTSEMDIYVEGPDSEAISDQIMARLETDRCSIAHFGIMAMVLARSQR